MAGDVVLRLTNDLFNKEYNATAGIHLQVSSYFASKRKNHCGNYAHKHNEMPPGLKSELLKKLESVFLFYYSVTSD